MIYYWTQNHFNVYLQKPLKLVGMLYLQDIITQPTVSKHGNQYITERRQKSNRLSLFGLLQIKHSPHGDNAVLARLHNTRKCTSVHIKQYCREHEHQDKLAATNTSSLVDY